MKTNKPTITTSTTMQATTKEVAKALTIDRHATQQKQKQANEQTSKQTAQKQVVKTIDFNTALV